MKSIITGIIFIWALSFSGISQSVNLDTIPSATNPATKPGITQSKLHLNVQAGSQFWSASGFGSGFNSYIMTGLSYPLGKRFSIEGGIGIINTTFTAKNKGLTDYYGYGNLNQTHTLVYVTGNYLLSRHITVSGTLWKDFGSFNTTSTNKYYKQNDPQGLYMNVKYKINDFMQIEAGFSYSKGVNLYGPCYLEYPGYGGSLWSH